MTLEKASQEIAQTATDTARTALKVAEGTVRKAWSLLDAASEKKAPSQFLSANAIKAIQGKMEAE